MPVITNQALGYQSQGFFVVSCYGVSDRAGLGNAVFINSRVWHFSRVSGLLVFARVHQNDAPLFHYLHFFQIGQRLCNVSVFCQHVSSHSALLPGLMLSGISQAIKYPYLWTFYSS